MSPYIIILNIFEAFACVTGFIYWNKIKHLHWKWFAIYLAVLLVTELTAEYFLHIRGDLTSNINIYRYFGVPLQFVFLYWLFYQEFDRVSLRKWPVIFGVVYAAGWCVEMLYINKEKFLFDSLSYAVGCLLLLVLFLLYIVRFSRSEELLHYRTSMMFWVSIGILFFYVGTLPFWGLRTTLYRHYKEFFYVYWYTQFVLNYLMYFLFAIAFIWGKPKPKYLLS